MANQAQRPTYIAYMLRLWREDATTWRGTLENPHTGERHAFATAADLFLFLHAQLMTTAVAPEPAADDE